MKTEKDCKGCQHYDEGHCELQDDEIRYILVCGEEALEEMEAAEEASQQCQE